LTQYKKTDHHAAAWKPLMSVSCFDKMSCTSSMIFDVNHCLPAMMFLSFCVRLPTQGDVSLSMCSLQPWHNTRRQIIMQRRFSRPTRSSLSLYPW
jgi:hypothetical protein